MKSGFDDYDHMWGNPFYDEAYEEIKGNGPFAKKIFQPLSALKDTDSVPGHVVMKPFEGQEYDHNKYELVENAWSHEHCKVCYFQITAGHSYWENEEENYLCDACYENYVLNTR